MSFICPITCHYKKNLKLSLCRNHSHYEASMCGYTVCSSPAGDSGSSKLINWTTPIVMTFLSCLLCSDENNNTSSHIHTLLRNAPVWDWNAGMCLDWPLVCYWDVDLTHTYWHSWSWSKWNVMFEHAVMHWGWRVNSNRKCHILNSVLKWFCITLSCHYLSIYFISLSEKLNILGLLST